MNSLTDKYPDGKWGVPIYLRLGLPRRIAFSDGGQILFELL